MPFLRSIQVKEQNNQFEFPFNLQIIKNLEKISFPTPVTFFIGENGSGKSTLLEAIAAGIGSIAVGSENIDRDKSLEHARNLASALKLVFSRKPVRGFFFRSEDMFGFTKLIQHESRELESLANEYDRTLTGYGRQLAVGMARGQNAQFASRYGDNPDGFSHGETLLNVLKSRIIPQGLYLLDEPETPLSPLRQLTLISLLKEKLEQGCQFIIATHSPILMAFPDSTIYAFDEGEIREIDYFDTEHYSLTKAFLDDPQNFIRRL